MNYYEGYAKSIKENADKFYEFYVSHKDTNAPDLIVTMYNYPNVLGRWRDIYPMEATYDISRNIILNYFRERGMPCTVTGPSGLGASGPGEIVQFINWIINHKEYLKYVPLALRIGKKLLSSYRTYQKGAALKRLRSCRPQIALSFELFIDDDTEDSDLFAYSQELIIDYLSLKGKLEASDECRAQHFPTFKVIFMKSNREIAVNFAKDPELKSMNKVLKYLNKLSPFSQVKYLTVRRRVWWYQLIKS